MESTVMSKIPDIAEQLAWIAVDWGSSNLRAWGLDQHDQVIAQASSDKGMLSLKADGYEAELLRLVGDWLPATGNTKVMVCGMAGARQGWQEAAYLPVPTRLDQLSQGAVTPTLTSEQLDVYLLPGLSQTRSSATHFDVMRGEETQLAGLVADAPAVSGLACLPGTQSVLQHSIGRDDLNDAACRDAFVAAVKACVDAPATYSSRLFGLRAQDLLDGQLASGEKRRSLLAARLSGLTIGLELAGACSEQPNQAPITLIGNQALCQRYTLALNAIGYQTHHVDGDTAVLSGLRLAHQALKA